jgi:transcriptional regulator with XRE-family HTH domain
MNDVFDFDYDFGGLLLDIRKEQGATRRDIAKEIGVSEQVLYYYETGRTRLTYETAERIAAVLGYTVPQILIDNALYDDYIPRWFDGNVDAWDKFKNAQMEDALSEDSLRNLPEVEQGTFEQILQDMGYTLDGDGEQLDLTYPDGTTFPVEWDEIEELAKNAGDYLQFLLEKLREEKESKQEKRGVKSFSLSWD